MKTTSLTALALVLGFGFAVPAAAQETPGADVDEDEFVTGEEATAYDEQRFDELSGGEAELTQEQFTGAMTGAEDAAASFAEVDADGSGSISREEWMQWRQQRFEDAAGDAGQLESPRYQDLDLGGAGESM